MLKKFRSSKQKTNLRSFVRSSVRSKLVGLKLKLSIFIFIKKSLRGQQESNKRVIMEISEYSDYVLPSEPNLSEALNLHLFASESS